MICLHVKFQTSSFSGSLQFQRHCSACNINYIIPLQCATLSCVMAIINWPFIGVKFLSICSLKFTYIIYCDVLLGNTPRD
jgi:hypothetical protein